MRLTVIKTDGTVVKDNLAYLNLSWQGTPDDVHALQWFDVSGWIEFSDPTLKPNEAITELPDWASNAVAAWDVANTPVAPTPPTAQENKDTASRLLYETDWTTIPDVSDPTKSNPHLTNVDEFLVYRNTVRQYAINPVAGYVTWPAVPQAIWSTN